MENDVLMDFKRESSHETWLDCYRIALDFGPAAAAVLIETLNEQKPITSEVS